MRILLSLVLLAVVCSLSSCSHTFYPKRNIEGTWEKQSTDIYDNGIRIRVALTTEDTYLGRLITITQDLKEDCFDTGDVIWYNVKSGPKGMYTMDEFWKDPVDCSTINTTKYIRFTDDNTIGITTMGIKSNTGENYQVWIRVTEE